MTDNPQDQPATPQQPDPTPPTPPKADQPPAYGQAPTYGQAPAYGAQGQQPVSPSDARMWSMLAHLGGILFGFVPSLVIYLIYKDRDPFIRRHATQALNFQIIMAIALFVSWILTSTVVLAIIGIPLMLAVGIAVLVFSIIAAMAANKGEEYTYPLVPQMVT